MTWQILELSTRRLLLPEPPCTKGGAAPLSWRRVDRERERLPDGARFFNQSLGPEAVR